LIAALPKILAEFPDAHLLLVGTGPYRKKLDLLIEENGVQGAVTFLGRLHLEELPLYLSIAEIFAMPSRDRLGGFEVEGLGIVYLEAGSCALPVIVGRSGGAPDALIDGETGILVDGNDSMDVTEACLRLLRDPLHAAKMGAKGREWVIAQWNWDRWAAEFQAALLR
jgi:phosphatidylinositol alpha-1,6-mannosyltransferase